MDKYSNDPLDRALNAEERAKEKFDKLIGNDPALNAMNQKISYLKHMETLKDIESFNKIVDSALKGESPIKSTFELLKRKYEKEEAYGTFDPLKPVSQRGKGSMSIRELENLRDDCKMGLLSGNITNPFEESLNRDKSGYIADYSLSAKWKDMGLRVVSGIPQGLGLLGDYVANHMNSTGKYLFSDTDKSYDEIFAKEQAENNGFSKFANWITSPLDEARAKINSQHLIGYDQLMDSYENEGLLDNLALTGSFALDLAPSLLETAIMALPGVGTTKGLAALGSIYLAENNKEEQGKKIGKTANQVQGVENTTDILDIVGAAGQAAFAVPELAMLKYAGGLAKSPTKSVFDAINKTKAKQSVDKFVDDYALAPGRWLYKGAGLAARPTAALGYMAAMEAISETGQEASKKIANEDWWNKSLAENMKDLKESAVLGAIGGASLGGGIRAVTAPIGYVANKAKEAEVFESTRERARNISETLGIEDKFSSSIEQETDSKGNVKKTRKVKNPMDSLSEKQQKNTNNIFYNLSQVSLETYDSDPKNSHKNSLLNVDNDTDVLKQIFSFAAAGFLNPIEEDGKKLYSQNIIEESINRARQAVREHIDSIIKSNPDTTTDEVISTLATFKDKMKDNSALDFYISRQMLTNPKEVAAILAEVANKNQTPTDTNTDTSVQNGSEGQSLNSYENSRNGVNVSSAVSQGQREANRENSGNQQGKATKAYTKEQLNNIRKAAKFISELTGIEELAANADQILNDNSNSNTTPKNKASLAVANMLNRINSLITALEAPEDTREDFRTNAELNTKLGAIITGHTTFKGERKKGLAAILQKALERINKAESKSKQKDQETIKDIQSLKWWLNSHRAKYKMYKKIVKDLKEAEENGRKPTESLYMIQKDITPDGIGDVITKEGKDAIVSYLRDNFKNSNSELDEELSEIITALESNENTYLSKTMTNLRNYLNSKGFGYHIYTITSGTKSTTPEKTLKEIEQEGKAITETLEILEDSTISEEELNDMVKEVNRSTNPSEEVGTNSSNENNTKEETKANTQTNQTEEENKPNQETKQDNSKDIKEQTTDVHSTNNNKWSYLTNVTKSPLVLNIGRRSYLFSSVEHAYQSLKHNDFSKPRSEWTLAEVYNKDWSNSKKIKSELKENRENNSNIKIMKYLLEERVKQDSKFKELLKETGNVTLTHNKDNTIWKNQFPKLLMEIRDNLNNENIQENTTSKQESKSNTESTPKVDNKEDSKFPNHSENFGKELGKENDNLKIIASTNWGYKPRTIDNINNSHITIAFANDFSTAGEQLTTNEANKRNKYLRPGSGRDTKHVPMSNLEALNNPKETAKEIAEFFKERYSNSKTLVLNIAGNGIYSLNRVTTQQELNAKMRDVLIELKNELPNTEIIVRSGGQTGMDLAGVVAGYSLGLKTIIHTPSGYRIRTKDGKDKSFKSKEEFIKYIRDNNMYKLDYSYKNNSTSTNENRANSNQNNNATNQNTSTQNSNESQGSKNTQTQEQENSDKVQRILDEASRDTKANEEFKQEELEELYNRGEGVDMEEEFSDSTTPQTLDEAGQQIKDNAEKLISNVKKQRDEKIESIKNEEQKVRARKEALDLDKTLKPKDNPKSILNILNEKDLKNVVSRINNALQKSFGLKEKLKEELKGEINFSRFNTFFAGLGSANFLMSKDLKYKNINNTSTFFSDSNVILSATIRSLEVLTDSRFSYSDFKDLKEKYPNLKNRREIPSEVLPYLLRGIPLADIANDIGKKILSDIGLEIDEKNTTLADADRIYQELGIAAIMSLKYLKLVNVTDVYYNNIYNNVKNKNASEKRVILNLNNVYTKEGSGNLSTAISFITDLQEDLKLDKNDYVNTYSTKPFSVREFVKTKQGIFGLTKKMYKAINAFLNTPFVVENYTDVKSFIDEHEGELKSFLGYKDLSKYIDNDRKLIEGKTPTELYIKTGIKYSDVDSVLGKNLQIENSINHLKDLLNDESAAKEGIYFNKVFASGRLWLQSSTVNPQSNKLHRFLVTLKTQTKTEKLKDGNLSDSTYVAIAQAFGYKTDKKTEAINVGKAIVETNGLREKVIEALGNKGEIELGNGTKLEIEEIGHALNALFNIEKFLNEKKNNPNLTEFKHNIVEEVDGINNGIALKGLTFFVSPKTFDTLLSTGISFFGELKDSVMPKKFSAKASENGKANPDKVWDTYEQFAIVTSEGFKKTTEILSNDLNEALVNLKMKKDDGVELTQEQEKELTANQDRVDVDYDFVNMANRFDITTSEDHKGKLTTLRKNVENFGRAMSGINNLVFVEGDPDTVESVSKEARKLNKYIVIPASYGSGLTANIRSLTTFVVDNFGDWVLKKEKDKNFENSPEWGIVKAILDSLSLLNPNISYMDYKGEPQELTIGSLKDFVLNNADGIGAAKVSIGSNTMTLYEFIDSHMKIVTKQGVKDSRDNILPGYESVNNSINSIHNLFQIILTNKYNMKAIEVLRSSGRLKGVDLEKNPFPTHLLTIEEHKQILSELRNDFPSITVDSKERFGENKEKRYVGRISMANLDRVTTPTNDMDIYYPGVSVKETADRSSGWIKLSEAFSMRHTSKSVLFSSVGATPTAIMTQQKDGTDMIEAMIESTNEKTGQLDINDIFDAILRHSSDASSNNSLISMYNRRQVNEVLNSSQLYEQTRLAAKAARDMSEVDEDILNTLVENGTYNGVNVSLSNGNSNSSIKNTLVGYTRALAYIMHMKYKISEVNKAIVRNLETVASNMQNGHKSDKATIKPEKEDLLKLVSSSIINDPYAEQDPKEFIKNNLMLDITAPEIANELSRVEELLNTIYDNRIPNNDKDINRDTIINDINEGIKNLNKVINSKIKSIQGELENIGANEVSKNLLRYIKPLSQGALSLEAKRENGRDVYQDNDEGTIASDNEIKEVDAKNSSSSNPPIENNEIEESKDTTTKPTKESKPKDSNVETEGEKSVIERLTEALEKILEPNSKKDRAIEAINQGKAKENTPDRVEKAKNKINDILKVGFNNKIDLRKLGKNKEGFTKLVESFKEKLENFNVDEYLQDKTKYLENMFKDIVEKDSIFDKINKEVLKSFENVDDTTVSDTSMDEFVSQIDLTTDKVSTTQEQMRSIDESNGRAMSKEFSNHLKGVLSELASLASEAVNGVKVKYFKSKGKGHNEGEYLTQLREILIKEGIPLNGANYTGVASLEETYSHELLHAITYYVIKAQKGSNPLTRELSMLHKRYLSVMTPSKLAKFINSGIESKDLEVANRIMSHFESNTIEGLAEFIAIALSNEAVWNSLKDIEVKSEPNYEGMTFGERVVAKAMNMFNTFFNSIYRKYQDSDSMQKAMLALATKIAAANSKAEYKIDKENDLNLLESADTLTTISRGLASGLDKLDEIGSEKLNKLKDYIKSSGVKLVSVPKSKRRKYNSRWEEIRGLVAILASDVTGDKVAQAALSVAHDIGLHYNGITQYIVSELSQMSDMKRKGEYLARKRKVLDSNRASNIKSHTESLEEYFNTPLTLAENQALGEGMLDTDLSSLLDHYSIDQLPDILNNIESYKEKAYSDMLKEVDKNFKDKVGKYPKDAYKRYITNQSNSLAYFMNFQSYRNEVEGAIGVKNPTMIAMMVGTGANIKPNKNVVSAIDKYVTLAALEYLESDVKELIINKLQTEPQGMEAMINYHRTNKSQSLAKNFGGNPALMIKGYRYDVIEDYINIKIAPISEESLLKSQGFRRVSKNPLRKSPDDNSEERYIYVNDFVSSTASFNQQAVSYLGHTGRGSKLSDIYNDKILKGSDIKAVEQEWYDSIVQLTKNSSLAARKLMSPNYSPANFKDKNDSENIMVPIFDENGNLRDFAYLMSKKTKKDLLGLDTSLTKSLSHMNARMIDKYEAQALNKVVADTLFEDYDNANEAERKYHFVEMSFESKDPYIREIYKMLEPSFKNYLEEKFNGKIMVRASTMLNFFGQRDMDYRNTANYREKDVPYKKLLLGSMDVARQLAKLAKMEIVLRFGSTIYNNVISNSMTLLIRGVPLTQIFKDQIEGGRLLNKYLKDTKELKKLEAKKRAGGDVRDVEIENLIRELERNPIKDMMDFGLFTTIQSFEDINLEDKDNSWTARQVRKYTVENENLSEGVRELMQKGFDIAFVTDRTVIGRGLTKFVQMGDFVARYTLFKHYMRDGKMDKKEALEKVSDEFINYDLPVNKVIKFANDYGFLFFTRYAIVSQKVMAMLASDRPVSASIVVGLQAMFNIDFADIFDGNVFTKNLGALVSNPFANLFNVLSPTGYDMVKGAYNRL